jgi:hypothetical protein
MVINFYSKATSMATWIPNSPIPAQILSGATPLLILSLPYSSKIEPEQPTKVKTGIFSQNRQTRHLHLFKGTEWIYQEKCL